MKTSHLSEKEKEIDRKLHALSKVIDEITVSVAKKK